MRIDLWLDLLLVGILVGKWGSFAITSIDLCQLEG